MRRALRVGSVDLHLPVILLFWKQCCHKFSQCRSRSCVPRSPIRIGFSRSNGMAFEPSYIPPTAAFALSRATETPSRTSPACAKDWLGTSRADAASLMVKSCAWTLKANRNSVISCSGATSLFFFDILWDEHAGSDDEEEMRRFRRGEDVRYLPLIDRKLRLRRAVPKTGERLLFCDHIETYGEQLFRLICEQDLEGIVAKGKGDPYLPEHATWLKIRNKNYSQWIGREQLFERERSGDPDFEGWSTCALVCNSVGELHGFRRRGSSSIEVFHSPRFLREI